MKPYRLDVSVPISSNPNFTPAAVSPREAIELLGRITGLPKHRFWPDDLPLSAAIAAGQLLVGHRQITDAYLVGLARKNGGRLATLDRGVRILPRLTSRGGRHLFGLPPSPQR